MKKQSLSFKGANIAFEDRGKGRTVVFLHGFLENRSMWAPMAEKLAKQFNPVLIDFPGHGDSENLGYAHKMELLAEIIHFVLRQLKKRKVVLVGHSMGGYAALAFADKYPDMLNGVVLLNSTARADSKERKTNRERGIELCKKDHDVFIRQSIPLLFRKEDQALHKNAILKLIQEARKMSKQGVIAAIEGMKVRPSREVLLKFPPYPVLFAAGKEDPVIPWKDSKAQMNRSENIQKLVFEHGGHMSFIENQELLYKKLRTFLYQCLP